MNSVDLITKKRDGGTLSRAEIDYFVNGFVSGDFPDYQAAAMAMAIYFQGMNEAETAELTLSMAASGDQFDLHQSLPANTIVVDKHSTGGVGDKTTLVVAPIIAACGLPVGKMSGRGLGFSGGTIDKLESIAGWTSELSEAQFRQQLQDIGLVIAGQTANLVPADKALYALRDVTGTVPSLPLIASSIMSKKLAAGADAIVLDCKCGNGSFLKTFKEAESVARRMVDIGKHAGRQVVALITQMAQPLGRAVGNALEVKEAIETLQGNGPADFAALVEAVASEMLALGRAERGASPAAIQDEIQKSIRSGAALDKFRAFVAAQGGDTAMVDKPALLPHAPATLPVLSTHSGYLSQIDASEIGLTAVALGGGRRKKGDMIDPRVGVICEAKIGDFVEKDQPLCMVHAAREGDAQFAIQRLQSAYKIDEKTSTSSLPIVYARIS